MKFDENIIKYMKKKSKFQNVKDEKLILQEFHKLVKIDFLAIKSIDDFLILLNKLNKIFYVSSKKIPLKYITYHAYHNKNLYTTFEIAKKSGGKRVINAPIQSLKNIQTTIAFMLSCIYKPQISVHGFTNNKSVVTNAKYHVNKNYVYNIDLKDFFTTIRKARIEKRLQVAPYNFTDEVATLISRLTTQKIKTKKYAVLPQGAPTSPIISNMICEQLDRRLLGLAKRFNLKYTRYADDITFSSMHNVYQADSEFINELYRIIDDQNFKINPQKTRLQKRGYRQEVTGIIVNDKINVNRRYIKQLRAMLYSIEKFGLEKAEEKFSKYYMKDKGHIHKTTPKMINVISGKLEYLKMVKGYDNSTYLKLRERFDAIFDVKNSSLKKEKIDRENEKLTKPMCKAHNPKKLVELLSSFSLNNRALKYTTHSWEWGQIEDVFDTYNDFLEQIKKEWYKMNQDLKKIAPRLQYKIYDFLLNPKLGEENDKGYIQAWGENKIEFGWSSPKLKEWCSDNKNLPFDFELNKEIQKEINGKDIAKFGDIVELFKKEIEIKSDLISLKKIFRDIVRKQLGSDFKVHYADELEIVDFYTDVQWFKIGLIQIFEEIRKRTQYPNIFLEVDLKSQKKYIEIKIIQESSVSNRDSQGMLERAEIKGNISEIKKAFCSLCDWSVEAKFQDGFYKINFLAMDEVITIKELENEPKGFTHILRFYR